MPICVVVGHMPGLLRDIVHRLLAGDPDIEVVARDCSMDDLTALVVETQPDVIIVACEQARIDWIGEQLLRSSAGSKLLAVTHGARAASLYELRPRQVPLGEMSPQTLGNAIRGIARGRSDHCDQESIGAS